MYKVTRDSCCVELYIFDIPDPENLQNKKRSSFCVIRTRDTKGHAHGHVTFRTRSWVIAAVWSYTFLTSMTLKTCKTKQNIIDTLKYKVTRDSRGLKLYIFDISGPKNLQNKKRSSLLRH